MVSSRQIVAALCAILLVSCAGEAPPQSLDTGVTPPPDYQQPTLDQAQQPKQDQYVWPDTLPPPDTWPHPADSYSASPFGCVTDADCFGRRCCATPWGVSLCADVCP